MKQIDAADVYALAKARADFNRLYRWTFGAWWPEPIGDIPTGSANALAQIAGISGGSISREEDGTLSAHVLDCKFVYKDGETTL